MAHKVFRIRERGAEWTLYDPDTGREACRDRDSAINTAVTRANSEIRKGHVVNVLVEHDTSVAAGSR